MADQLARALSPALKELGYTVTPSLRLIESTTLASADLVAFGSRVPSFHTSCLAANWCPSPAAAQKYALSLAQTGAPIIYLAYSSDGGGQVWEMELDLDAGNLRANPSDQIPLSGAGDYLRAHRERFEPKRVLRTKFSDGGAVPAEAVARQPSFASLGLLDLQQEQTEQSLVRLLDRVINAGLAAWDGAAAEPEDAEFRTGLVFLRLMAACALRDKGIIDSDRMSLEETVQAARGFLPHFLSADSIRSVPPQVLRTLWEHLKEVRFELLTGDMLAGLYAKGLVTPDFRRKHGVYYTPPAARRMVWRSVRDYVASLPSAERIIVDPTCGSGGFMLTAYDGIATLEGQDLFHDHNVESMRDRLLGVDLDPFATDIARLSLILRSQPITNGWRIDTQDFTHWEPPPDRIPRVILGNPPFGGKRRLAVKMLLHALDCVAPGGLVSLVMPTSFLTGAESRRDRQSIFDRARVMSIASFPETTFAAQVSTCLMTAKRHDSAVRPTYVVRYGTLDSTLSKGEQKRRLQWGDGSFVRWTGLTPQQVLAGELDLTGVWARLAALKNTQALGSLVDFHQGIRPKGRSSDPEPEISDVPFPACLPFLENARDFIEPFCIRQVRYLRWQPDRFYRKGKPEWWCPGKLVLARHVSHHRRWRLFGAVDCTGVVYDSRILGGFTHSSDWTVEAVLGLLSSNYANAWYSSHSSQMDITDATLSLLPVPPLSEDQRELLSSISGALSACAHRARGGYGVALEEPMHAYLSAVLLRGIDETICSAAGLTREERAALDGYLGAQGEPRPGLVANPAPTQVVAPIAEVRHVAGVFRSTTGIVLAIDSDTSLAVVWLDGLDLRLPIAVPLPEVPAPVRWPGAAITVRAALGAASPGELKIADIAAFPAGNDPRATIVDRLAQLGPRP